MQIHEVVDRIQADPQLMSRIQSAAAAGTLAELAGEYGMYIDAQAAQAFVARLAFRLARQGIENADLPAGRAEPV